MADDEPLATIVDAVLGYAVPKLSKSVGKVANYAVEALVLWLFGCALRAVGRRGAAVLVLVGSFALVGGLVWLHAKLCTGNLAVGMSLGHLGRVCDQVSHGTTLVQHLWLVVHEYFSLRALAPLFIMAVLVLTYFLVNRWLSVALLVLNLACFTLLESYLDQDSLSYLGVLLVVTLLVFFFAYIMFVVVPNGRNKITLCRHKMRGRCSNAKCEYAHELSRATYCAEWMCSFKFKEGDKRLQSIADHYGYWHKLDKDGKARVRGGSFPVSRRDARIP